MIQLLLSRLATVPVLLVLVSVVVFGFIHIAPGGPVDLMLGHDATPEEQMQLSRKLGLDRPLHEQYASWLWDVIRGDFQQSLRTNEPVLSMIIQRIPASLTLALWATLISLTIAVPVGILSAYRHNTVTDYISSALSMLAMAMPNFVVALVLILVLAIGLGILPIAGAPSITREPLRAIPYYVMPSIALGLYFAALQTRVMRASLLDTLASDYVRTAHAKGLALRRVLVIHALRNALIPLVTIAAINFAQILSGTVIIEQIFGIPGVGSLFLQAILQRDFPVVQGIALVIASIFIAANVVADILYGVLDPRIRQT